MIKEPVAVIMVLMGILVSGFWLEKRYRWAAKIGGSSLIILMGILLSNCGLITTESPVYSAIYGPVTSLAIIWLLFAIDFKQLKTVGPNMLMAFLIAVVGTVTGIITAFFLLRSFFPPEEFWKLCGCETGSYIGGNVNLTALARQFKLEHSVSTAIIAADNIVTTLWMGATLILPVFLASFYPVRVKNTGDSTQMDSPTQKHEFSITDFGYMIFIGFVIIFLAQLIQKLIPFIPEIIILSTLALIIGHMKWIKKISGTFQMGMLALNLVLAVMGISAKISEVVKVGPQVFYFTSCVVLVHGILIFSIGKLMKIDIETLAVASQAAIGGPSTALALATSKKWKDLILPGTLVGLLGYAVGNYLGVLIAYAAKYFLHL